MCRIVSLLFFFFFIDSSGLVDFFFQGFDIFKFAYIINQPFVFSF